MRDTDSTLAELVASRPEAAEVLHKHGLDFCCHGQRSLAEACREGAVDPELVRQDLEKTGAGVPPSPDWSRRSIGEIIDFILTRYHEPLREKLPVLIALARTVESVHTDKQSCPRGLADHLERLRAAVESHLQKEERILFPLLCAGKGAGARMPVNVMMLEHEDHGENLRRTRALARDFALPPEACLSWQTLYRGLEQLESELMAHIHLENYVLFPRALQGGDARTVE